jgi:hypothetical protein
VGSVRDREIVDLHAERFGTQTFAHAGGAWRGGLVAADFLAHPGAVGFAEAALEVADDALERLGDFVAAHAIVEDEVDFSSPVPKRMISRARSGSLFQAVSSENLYFFASALSVCSCSGEADLPQGAMARR